MNKVVSVLLLLSLTAFAVGSLIYDGVYDDIKSTKGKTSATIQNNSSVPTTASNPN